MEHDQHGDVGGMSSMGNSGVESGQRPGGNNPGIGGGWDIVGALTGANPVQLGMNNLPGAGDLNVNDLVLGGTLSPNKNNSLAKSIGAGVELAQSLEPTSPQTITQIDPGIEVGGYYQAPGTRAVIGGRNIPAIDVATGRTASGRSWFEEHITDPIWEGIRSRTGQSPNYQTMPESVARELSEQGRYAEAKAALDAGTMSFDPEAYAANPASGGLTQNTSAVLGEFAGAFATPFAASTLLQTGALSAADWAANNIKSSVLTGNLPMVETVSTLSNAKAVGLGDFAEGERETGLASYGDNSMVPLPTA